MNYGFIRASCASPAVSVANCTKNADAIIDIITQAENAHAAILVLPELAITGYTCGDLFLQDVLLKSALNELLRIASHVKTVTVAVGLPLAVGANVYNVAAVLSDKTIKGFVPKTYLSDTAESSERRRFCADIPPSLRTVTVRDGEGTIQVPFGTDLLFTDTADRSVTMAVELGEDLFAPIPPSTHHARNGATIIANCSAVPETIGAAHYRRTLLESQSARSLCAYLYAEAGKGESTTDTVYSAHNLIYENGTLLVEQLPFTQSSAAPLIVADIDTESLINERRRNTTFSRCVAYYDSPLSVGACQKHAAPSSCYRIIDVSFTKYDSSYALSRTVSGTPFIPSTDAERKARATEVIAIQTAGLVKRLTHTHAQTAVIGLSGGLDSTLALLITANAFASLSIEAKHIHAVTMPCFGTTNRTYTNAVSLAHALGATLHEIPLQQSVLQHFSDIGHDSSVHDTTYENAQARERTQVLMDIANKLGGLVIGTGDLSELALGWATYNGDHMSMYGVNAAVPKTLVRHLVLHFASVYDEENKTEAAAVLRDILDTPVSPELLPPKDGDISQKTEDIVGPYELHDFVLYFFLRKGFAPEKILFLAEKAFNGVYSRAEILNRMRTFIRRFFTQQFKRSCLPDGPKIGSVGLSPRGELCMPSDAEAHQWLNRLEGME